MGIPKSGNLAQTPYQQPNIGVNHWVILDVEIGIAIDIDIGLVVDIDMDLK